MVGAGKPKMWANVYRLNVKYLAWVDRVLFALDRLSTGDATASLIGVDLWALERDLDVVGKEEGERAVIAAVNDLEVVGCVEADGRRVKMTTQGHRFARAGGLRPGWKSLFSARTIPLDEDLAVLRGLVEHSVHETDELAWTERVEVKDVLAEVGQPRDQGGAIAVSKRLQALTSIHSGPVFTAGPDGYCQVHPSYVGIVVATQRLATEERELLRELVKGWETTSIDVKESLQLNSDRQKAEFVKDVMALGNTIVTGRRFLVLGFNNDTRKFTTNVDPRVDAHRMESILGEYCAPVPEIRYTVIPVEGKDAGLIEVLGDRTKWPYRLARDVWKFTAGSVWVRHNTLVQLASEEEVAYLEAEGARARAAL